MNNSNNTNLKSVVQVAFMPINALLPYMQKFCDDFQNNSYKSDTSSHMLNRFDPELWAVVVNEENQY
jgi:hypothetical protein